MCEAARCPFVFVINAYPVRSTLTTAMTRELRDKGMVLEEMVGNRTSYAGAYMMGKSAAEIDRGDKAEEEVRALWKRITKMMATTKKSAR
jgi:cellulose biosynthesis protein BcsQ